MALEALRDTAPAGTTAAPAIDPESDRIVPIAELAFDSPEPEPEPELEEPDPEIMALLEEIVPIEQLAPDAPPMEDFAFIKAEAIEAVVEIAAVVVPADREPTTFEASLLAYSELVHDLGVGQASLEELIGARGAESNFVSIDDLLYRGRPALLRAAEVRSEIRSQLERGQHIAVVRPLLDELLDLIPLALDGH
jgi:hypothetical protein